MIYYYNFFFFEYSNWPFIELFTWFFGRPILFTLSLLSFDPKASAFIFLSNKLFSKWFRWFQVKITSISWVVHPSVENEWGDLIAFHYDHTKRVINKKHLAIWKHFINWCLRIMYKRVPSRSSAGAAFWCGS